MKTTALDMMLQGKCPVSLKYCSSDLCSMFGQCQHTSAWPLPFELYSRKTWDLPEGTLPAGTLKVQFPRFDNDDYNSEWECERKDEYNTWIQLIRAQLIKGKWMPAVLLPYYFSPQATIVVDEIYVLATRRKTDVPIGFCPAIPLSGRDRFFSKKEQVTIHSDGFYTRSLWPRNFPKREIRSTMPFPIPTYCCLRCC